MPLINCKVGLKLKWTKSCVLAAAGVDNADAYSNNFIFVVKGTKLCIPAVTLSAKDHQKLSKLHSKRFERSVYWNEYRTKSKNKNMAHQYRYLLKSNCVGVNRFFFVVYSNQDDNSKTLKVRSYYLPKDHLHQPYHQWEKLTTAKQLTRI